MVESKRDAVHADDPCEKPECRLTDQGGQLEVFVQPRLPSLLHICLSVAATNLARSAEPAAQPLGTATHHRTRRTRHAQLADTTRADHTTHTNTTHTHTHTRTHTHRIAAGRTAEGAEEGRPPLQRLRAPVLGRGRCQRLWYHSYATNSPNSSLIILCFI
jgi:hypothetical protein